MKQYIDLLKDVLENGGYKGSRTGVGTYSVFGRQMRFDLQEGFPLVTTKKVHLKSIIHELLWFIKGDTNIQYLTDNGVKIWNEWATETGDLGPVYGEQWRDFTTSGTSGTGVDQLTLLIEGLKTRPDSRRHIISAWNPTVLPDESITPQENALAGKMALPPCHLLIQFNVRTTTLRKRIQRLAGKGINVKDFGVHTPGFERYINRLEMENGLPTQHTLLDCSFTMRSVDVCLGAPFNIASYAALTMMIADVCGYAYGDLIWNGGDVHVYENHLEGAELQITRTPRKLPKLFINKRDNIEAYRYEDFLLMGYDHDEPISFPIAI